MRPKLLKSFILVSVFWFLATTLYWSFSDPAVNLDALRALKRLMPFLSVEVPKSVSILQSISVQMKVLAYWTLPLMGGTALSFIIGYGYVWVLARRSVEERTSREKGGSGFRGVGLTLGELPVPQVWPRNEVELSDEPNGPLGKATDGERRLLEQIFGTLQAHPDAYGGPGNSGSLLSHAMAVAHKALETHKLHPGLAACVAAGHELGKILAYKKNPETGAWALFKDEDREASRLLASLPAWWTLPPMARESLLLAVKFKSAPRTMPEIECDKEMFRLAQDLLYTAKDVQTEIVQQEKQKTLEKHELPEMVFAAFQKALPMLAFQNRGLPKGVRAVAWKAGKRVYMLEIALRESVTGQMPTDIVQALQPTGKARPRVQPFTVELLKALESNKWLVTKIGEMQLPPADAIWTVQAGKLEFRGVIVIDVPDEFMSNLPAQDSMYEVAVTGALFTSSLVSDKPAAIPGMDKPTKSALAGVLDME